MDNHDYITEEPERRRCQHLQREERGTIQHLHRMKWTLRQIAKQINCSASTIKQRSRPCAQYRSEKGQKASNLTRMDNFHQMRESVSVELHGYQRMSTEIHGVPLREAGV